MNFVISDNSSSDRVGALSSGGSGTVSTSMLMNIMCLNRPCPLVRGLYNYHPVWVFLRTLSWPF